MTNSNSNSNSKLVIFLMIIGLFTACSNNLNKQNLIGTWRGHIGCKEKDSISTNVFIYYFDFLPNDSFTSRVEFYKKSKGTWSLDNKELTLKYDSLTSLIFPIDTFRSGYFHFTVPRDSNRICTGTFERLEDNLTP
jgi:hypothetical protein